MIRFEAQDDVYRKICSSDCMLLPSVEEGIANVVLEAMVIGLPVISSNCGGMGEIIDHQKNGFLFRNRDVDHLTQVMIDMINLDTAQRTIVAERARATVEEKHNLPRLGNEMKELYQAIKFP